MSIYLLSEMHHEGVINLPLIESTCKDIKIDLDSYDATIFSSKNGVKAIDKINPSWKNIPSFCIGKATANEVKKLGGKVEYIASSSYGDDFANELIDILADKRVIFLRAKVVLSKLETILENKNIDLSSQIVYETKCKKNDEIKLKDDAVIIFTAPSTIKCFFEQYTWKDTYQAVCIGRVTSKYLPDNIQTLVSKKQTISDCITIAKTLIKQN